MKRRFSVLRILLAISLLVALTACHTERRSSQSMFDGTTLSWAQWEKDIHQKVNAERLRRRLAPLQWDDAVCSASRSHSTNMAKRAFFSHKDPVRGGLQKRVDRQKLEYSTCGENLFRLDFRPDLSDAVVKGWMNSPNHRKNILAPEFKVTGIGISKGKDGFVYITQIFLAP